MQVNENKPNFPVDSGTADNAICHIMKRQYTTDQVIEYMRKRQGQRTQREFAEELGVSQQYLCDVYLRRREPGDSILKNLGIVRRTIFEVVAS